MKLLWKWGIVSLFLPISVYRKTYYRLGFRFLSRYVEGRLDVYKWTGKNNYVNLNTSRLAAGAYILFIASKSGIVYYS
jgi:hypothetical protein